MENNSGYTTIVVNGEEIGLRFGLPANRMFVERVASDDSIISDDTINEVGIAALLHAGYINNCMIKDIHPSKTFGFFMEFVETTYLEPELQKELNRVMTCYSQSKYTKKMSEGAKEIADEIKKKMIQ